VLLQESDGIKHTLPQRAFKPRNSQGPFVSRDQILKVPGVGPKAFEQAAGFLRIRDGKNPLDASAVHPESYGIVKKMIKDLLMWNIMIKRGT